MHRDCLNYLNIFFTIANGFPENKQVRPENSFLSSSMRREFSAVDNMIGIFTSKVKGNTGSTLFVNRRPSELNEAKTLPFSPIIF